MKVTSRSSSVERNRVEAKDRKDVKDGNAKIGLLVIGGKAALPVIDKKRLSVVDLMNKTMRCRSASAVTDTAPCTLLVKGEGLLI